MKIEIDTNDVFFAGGNYDQVHLVNPDKTFDVLNGQDSYWFLKVKKGTPSHDSIKNVFANWVDPASEQNAKADQTTMSRIPIYVGHQAVGWMEIRKDVAKELVETAIKMKSAPIASMTYAQDNLKIHSINLLWSPDTSPAKTEYTDGPKRISDYKMVRDVMVGSWRFAGARFTEKEADELCEMIRQRASLPPLPNDQSDQTKVESLVHAQDSDPSPAWTPRVKKILMITRKIAIEYRQNYVASEHLLAGIISDKESLAARLLDKHGITMDLLIKQCGWQTVLDSAEAKERAEYERLRAKFDPIPADTDTRPDTNPNQTGG